MTTPEAGAKNKIIEQLKILKKAGAPIRWKSSAGSMYGDADVDLTICFYGRYIGVEVKRFDGKGELTKRQKLCLQEIIDAGGDAYVLDSLESLKGFTADLHLYHHVQGGKSCEAAVHH